MSSKGAILVVEILPKGSIPKRLRNTPQTSRHSGSASHALPSAGRLEAPRNHGRNAPCSAYASAQSGSQGNAQGTAQSGSQSARVVKAGGTLT